MLRGAVGVVAALVVAGSAAPVSAGAPVLRCAPGPAPGVVRAAPDAGAQVSGLARLASLATGAGVRVAVLDSGVDGTHPQLTGAVVAGRDVLRGDRDARRDCVGHGTGVAGVIAARPVPGVPFRGVAPGATVVPVRVTEQRVVGGGADQGSPAGFAEAIRWAADPGGGDADVINLSVVMTADDAAVRAAVAAAVGAGVVVVAAAGNDGDRGGAVPFPASYPGVIGVGAVTAAGVRAGFSPRGGFVDLVAAGSGVTVAAPGGGYVTADGTSYAAPLVSGAAALVLQRFPGSTPAQVARRLTATADPAPGGRGSAEYGAGLLNPYRALTETLGPPVAGSPAPVAGLVEDRSVVAVRDRRARSQRVALVVAAGGVGAVLVLAVVAGAVRRGRRRGWRPAGV